MEVWQDLENMKKCPIEVTINYLGKKWTIQLIRDLFKGKKRFSEFLKANPQISTKMLSLRLKELQESGIVKKEVVSTTPLIIEYSLSKKGKDLNKVIFYLAEFSLRNYSDEVYNKKSNSVGLDILRLKNFFRLNK
ncbi:MAG: winged helix-turn-helix transcriptional regulator [Candidatus Thorarchaeota archaeon]